ncbi:peptide alpha-N-acetyltransferase Nat2 [Aspergillus sp. HF37]|nr:peptide alpha-N-acetyltransferase Nat2 [Aspergillus sp. HF37]
MSFRPALIPRLLKPQGAWLPRPSLPGPCPWRGLGPGRGPGGPSRSIRRLTTPPRTRPIRSPRTPPRRGYSTHPNKEEPKSDTKHASFSQRMRRLSREYGWSALGVYLLLSALDFPFCFAAVRLLGVDRIGHYEQVIMDSLRSVLPGGFGGLEEEGGSGSEGDGDGAGDESQIARANRRNSGAEASIWTQLALAYAIHKSFIFLRVPLTAAVTPKVVKVLRRWGWDIGKRKPKGS